MTKIMRTDYEDLCIRSRPLPEVITLLQELSKKYGEDSFISGGEEVLYLAFKRLETDREYDQRLKLETAARKNLEVSRRALYEQLKKEFGND